MKYIDTGFLHITILDDKTVLVAAINGIEIDDEKSKYTNDLIQSEMQGSYGMIVDRTADYSIVPADVYRNLNNNKKLKAIAVVVNNKINFLPIELEKKFYSNQLEVFKSIKDAYQWLTEIVN